MNEERKPTLTITGLADTLLEDLAAPPERIEGEEEHRPFPHVGEALHAVATTLREEQHRVAEELEARRRAQASEERQALHRRKAHLEARLKGKQPLLEPDEDAFIVAGRVIDAETGMGLPNVLVTAFDLDRKYDDRLGETRTGELGYFHLSYTQSDFGDVFDEQPETYIEVRDEEGEVLYTSSKSFIHKAQKAEFIRAEVDGERVPTSKALGQKAHRRASDQVRRLQRRIQMLSYATMERVGEASSTPSKKAIERSISDVKGIGQTYAARLEEEGITDITRLVDLGTERLAHILGTSATRAEGIVENAKQLIKSRNSS